MRAAGLATVIVACLLLGPAGALGAGDTVTSDSLPEVPAGGLAGLRVAVLTGDEGGGNVARAVSERLSADGAELVNDPTDLDALILAGSTGEPVGLPAGLDADALVIDLSGGPELAGVVALGMDRAAADRMGAELVATIALEREAGAVGVIGSLRRPIRHG